jgi:hypothetical protein
MTEGTPTHDRADLGHQPYEARKRKLRFGGDRNPLTEGKPVEAEQTADNAGARSAVPPFVRTESLQWSLCLYLHRNFFQFT